MEYDRLSILRRSHPAWRLLLADHAPLIASFLYATFVGSNVRALAESELTAKLEDQLYHVRAAHGADSFPKPAAEYLADWAADERGWLRRYYPDDSDEAHFDLTPAAERAVEWLAGLDAEQHFVGTESRLLTVFELLRELVEGTETDPQVRIDELERRKASIDAEIARVRAGELEFMDATRVRERFLQIADTARGLLGDFRQVEQNFRDLDRSVRERIATWEGGKGELLEEIFGERDAIADSDQGKSFRGFWDFLMSPSRQEELGERLDYALGLPAVRELEPDPRLRRVHYDWLDAGEVAQRTVARLSEQLRRYLDDQAWLENRRIMTLLREVEHHALAVREHLPRGTFMHLDEPAPRMELAMDRPLYSPPLKPVIEQSAVDEGDADIPTDALFEQVYVDRAALSARIRRALQTRDQITLPELLTEHPLELGLAELVTYLSLAADDEAAVIDDNRRIPVEWTDTDGRTRRAHAPLVIFGR
ncbi:DUF3375 domain-containing protein [Arhodomonas sp. AD133]|uniref:DUF3375 domain-containing protein n=1 Tax=Arhodomonas sp. AD133 TaxID=3415009 RepID=UPI003EC14199